MCLAQGHNAVTPVRFEPAAPRSRLKHSTTEPLRSQITLKEDIGSLIECWTLDREGPGPILIGDTIRIETDPSRCL